LDIIQNLYNVGVCDRPRQATIVLQIARLRYTSPVVIICIQCRFIQALRKFYRSVKVCSLHLVPRSTILIQLHILLLHCVSSHRNNFKSYEHNIPTAGATHSGPSLCRLGVAARQRGAAPIFTPVMSANYTSCFYMWRSEALGERKEQWRPYHVVGYVLTPLPRKLHVMVSLYEFTSRFN
jgi:hypothetical protein